MPLSFLPDAVGAGRPPHTVSNFFVAGRILLEALT